MLWLKLDTILNSLNLKKKFTLLLLFIFLAGTILSGIGLSMVLNYNAQMQFTSEAMALLTTMNAIRQYTDEQVSPKLDPQSTQEFLPQSIPTYARREVFEIVRKDPNLSDFFYKDATLNPTNLRDKADEFEEKIVEKFKLNSNLQELKGFRQVGNKQLFYIARPLVVSAQSCLDCHSQPEKAPKSQIERYGTVNGFGWKLNEIIGTQIIFVPSTTVYQRIRQSQVIVIAIVIGVFMVAIGLVNIWLKRYVIQPLRRMAYVAEAVSKGDMNGEFDQQSQDEVGMLAQAFTRMKVSLQLAMQRLNNRIKN